MKKVFIALCFLFVLQTPVLAANDDSVRIAAVLFPELAHQSKQDFLKMLDHYIDDAQQKQVKILLFPELLTANLLENYDAPTFEQLSHLAQFAHEYEQHLKSKAKSSGMVIIGGTTFTEKNHKIYNTAIVALPQGEIKTVDKMLLTPWEVTYHIAVGKIQPLTFTTRWGKVAILICYEAESSELLNILSKVNPDLVFIPSSTTGLYGLERVQVAARYLALSQFSYALLTGVSTNLPKEQVADNDVGQAILAAPMQSGYPLNPKLGKFNQPDLFIVDVDLRKIKQDKLASKSTFSARDFKQQHEKH